MQQIFFPTILSHQRTKCTNQKASKASITTSVLFGCSDFAFFIQFQRYLHNRHNIYLLQSRGKLRWKHKPTAKHKWEAVSRHGFSSTILTSTIVKELQCCGILIRVGVWVWLRQKKKSSNTLPHHTRTSQTSWSTKLEWEQHPNWVSENIHGTFFFD